VKSGNVLKKNGLSEMWEHWIEKYFFLVSEGLVNSHVFGKTPGGGDLGLVSRTIPEFF
jgi:hypothetical protein